MNIQQIAMTLSKRALEAKAQTGKAAKANYTGRKRRSKKEPSVIHSGRRKDIVPVLQKQLLHKYICACRSKKKKKKISEKERELP